MTLCEEEVPSQDQGVTIAFDLKSFTYEDRTSAPLIPAASRPNCVEKNSMVWNKAGKRIILDDDFERRVERERNLRMSLDSESCALIQLGSKSSFFRSFSSSAVRRRRTGSSVPCATTPLPEPNIRKSKRNVFSTCFVRDDNDDDGKRVDDGEENVRESNRRERITKLFHNTGNIALKIVAVPAVIIFDIAGSIFG